MVNMYDVLVLTKSYELGQFNFLSSPRGITKEPSKKKVPRPILNSSRSCDMPIPRTGNPEQIYKADSDFDCFTLTTKKLRSFERALFVYHSEAKDLRPQLLPVRGHS